MSKTTDKTPADDQPQFRVERIYVKDLSFEAPHSPKLFLEKWQPAVNLDIRTEHNVLDGDAHEVVLHLVVTVKKEDDVAVLVEVKQAGIFTMVNFTKDQAAPVVGIHCPTILYPYAQQVCAQLVQQGGYPPLYLSPINFEAMYQEQSKQQAKQKGAQKAEQEEAA